MLEVSCCAYYELVSQSGPQRIAGARHNIIIAMRQLGEIEFDARLEFIRVTQSSREKRCVENKRRLSKILSVLLELSGGIEDITRMLWLDRTSTKAVFRWTTEIATLWGNINALRQTFTCLERANKVEECTSAAEQIMREILKIREQARRCNARRSMCIKAIACQEHAYRLPVFGTLLSTVTNVAR